MSLALARSSAPGGSSTRNLRSISTSVRAAGIGLPRRAGYVEQPLYLARIVAIVVLRVEDPRTDAVLAERDRLIACFRQGAVPGAIALGRLRLGDRVARLEARALAIRDANGDLEVERRPLRSLARDYGDA